MKGLALDEVHHDNKQSNANLVTKPKLRCTVFLIRNFMRSDTICWRKFNNDLALLAIVLNCCLEHSFLGMLRGKAGQIVDFKLVFLYFEIPEMRKYGWGDRCAG